MPKTSGLINPAEIEIGARIREFRKSVGWHQAAFAQELGITRDKLASIEYGRTPLRYKTGKLICDRFNISQMWLAEALGSPHPKIELSSNIESVVRPSMLFSVAIINFVKPRLGALRLALLQKPLEGNLKVEFLTPLGLPVEEQQRWVIQRQLESVIDATPTNQRAAVLQKISAAIESVAKSQSVKKEAGLTDSSLKSISTDVQSEQLPMLLKRLNAATAQRGQRAALAKCLNVEAARVSEWLSGTKEPGGESTLQLLAWVEAEEAKQKSPGDASNITRAKTRIRKSSNEKPDSGQPKN